MGKGGIALGLLLLALLPGCGLGRSQPRGTPVPTATPAAALLPTVEQDAAISYEEIQRDVDHITGRDVDPTAPEVGPDGVVDQRIMARLEVYNQALSGKKAVNWQGWYKGAGSYEDDKHQRRSIIDIWMKDPPVPDACCAQVSVWGITPEQQEALPAMKIGQHIQFSGTIDQANSGGQVEIHDATVRLLP